jgi:hypothetical protein
VLDWCESWWDSLSFYKFKVYCPIVEQLYHPRYQPCQECYHTIVQQPSLETWFKTKLLYFWGITTILYHACLNCTMTSRENSCADSHLHTEPSSLRIFEKGNERMAYPGLSRDAHILFLLDAKSSGRTCLTQKGKNPMSYASRQELHRTTTNPTVKDKKIHSS